MRHLVKLLHPSRQPRGEEEIESLGVKIQRRNSSPVSADKWLKKSPPPPTPIYRCLESLGLSRIIKTFLPPSLLRVFHNPVVASSDKRHCSCEAAQPNNCLIDAAQLSWIAYLLHRGRLPFTLRAHPSRARQLLFHPRGTAGRRGFDFLAFQLLHPPPSFVKIIYPV